MRTRLALLALSLVAACREPARPAPTLSRDPVAWVPPSTRALVAVDLARVRAAPALARWVRSRAGSGCVAALSERVRSVAIVAPRGDLDEFAVVLSGDLRAEAVTACVRATTPGATVRALRHRGVPVVRVEGGADGGVGRGAAEVDLLPNGVALVGPPLLVRSLLDAGISLSEGESEPHALGALWDALPRGAAVRLAARLEGPRGDLPFEALRASVDLGARVTVRAHALTADDERAVELAHRAVRWRGEAVAAMRSEALRGILEGLRVRAAGRAVEAELSLDAGRLDALWSALTLLAAGPAASPPPSPPPR